MLTKRDVDSLKSIFPTKDELRQFRDDVMEKLDKFVGDIRDKREVQELHTHDHDRIDKRLRIVEKHLRLPSVVD